jgi:glycosyltransferase involved in cell wall biosynthesis
LNNRIKAQIRVLQVGQSLGVGGTERTLQILTEHLDSQHFLVAACDLGGGGVYGEQLRKAGYTVYDAFRDDSIFGDIIREFHPDVVHIHREGGPGSCSAAIRISHNLGVPVIVETNVFGRWDPTPVGQLVDMILHISKTCAIRYKAWAGLTDRAFANRCRVVYYPVDLSAADVYRPSAARRTELKQNLGIGDVPVIGRLGRPSPSKWGNLTTSMMPHLLKLVPDVVFVAMGAHESVRAQVRRANLESHFVFLDPSPDLQKVYEIYHLLDVLTYSSAHGESFGRVLAEAMACGKPVVVNSTPLRDNAQIELVDHGRTGYVANHPRDFAEAVAHLLADNDLRAQMGKAGRAKVEENLEASRVAESLGKIYIELLGAKGQQLDDTLLESYAGVEIRPSISEVLDFTKEYSSRLRTAWGRYDAWKVWAYELLATNYRFHKVGASMAHPSRTLRKLAGI